MDNNHLSNNHHHTLSHSVAEIGDRMNMLNVSGPGLTGLGNVAANGSLDHHITTSSRSLPTNYVETNNISSPVVHNNPLSSRSNSSPNSVVTSAVPPPTSFSKPLNPSAQEFVPRFSTRTTVSNPIPTVPYHQHQQQHAHHATNNHSHHHHRGHHMNAANNNNNHLHGNTNHHHPAHHQPHHYSNGTNNLNDNEDYIEDYMSLSYLKDFINHISNKPSMYDQGIDELTLIINSYLDEDDCVLELIVNQIVDQSIIDGNFLYNGVRLCYHFMEKLRETNSGQSFKQLLLKRIQRECTRNVTDITSANTFIHLRGLALFTAELYARCQEPELAEHLPSLLTLLLSSDIIRDENVKCVCDVLKLCGQQMEMHFNIKGRKDFSTMLDKLKDDSLNRNLSSHIKDLVKRVLTTIENNWASPQASINSNIFNPYLNANPATLADGHFDSTNNQYDELYDFGNCGDENNVEVCADFENFLKSTHQN